MRSWTRCLTLIAGLAAAVRRGQLRRAGDQARAAGRRSSRWAGCPAVIVAIWPGYRRCLPRRTRPAG